MEYLLLGLLVSIGWHVGKLIFDVIDEVVFSRLHANKQYAVLCKKIDPPQKTKSKGKPQEDEPYKTSAMGFMANLKES